MSSSDYLWDHEGLALWAYRAAGLDPYEPQGGAGLGEAILGPGSVDLVPGSMLYRDAQLVELDQAHLPGIWPSTSTWYIWTRRNLGSVERAWGVAHEGAEWLVVKVARYQGEDIEPYTDATASCLLLPRPLIHARLGGVLDLGQAEELLVTPACLALRWAEVMGESVAIVGPRGVECRGWGWPEDPDDLRRWMREDGWVWIDGRLRGLVKTEIGRRETMLRWRR